MSLATVILAAGKGTRMRSEKPKVLHEVGGKPMVQRVIDVARQLNSKRIILVVGYKADEVKSALSDQPDLEFAVQSQQLGTAHALLQTKDLLQNHNGPVLVLSGDVPLITAQTLQTMICYHVDNELAATVASFILPDPTGYGRIHRNCLGRFIGIVEEKDIGPPNENLRKSGEVNAGIYLFRSPLIFQDLDKIDNKNAQGEYYLPDIIKLWRGNHYLSAFMNPKLVKEAQGVNTIEQLKQMETLL